MQIGILTFWKTEDNYGQLLQCYATQTYLRSLGHEPFLVKTTNGYDSNPGIKKMLFAKLRTAYRLKWYPLYLLKRIVASVFYTLTHGKLRQHHNDRGFEQFRQEYLNCTKEEYTLEGLKNAPPKADAFVVGSDQIWNTTDGIYFLSWTNDECLKVSIAASFGARTATPDFCNLITPWLRRFSLVTIREQSGLDICKKLGRSDAKLIPDPTLLLRKNDYLKIMSDASLPAERYLFIYFLGTRTSIDWRQIHKFAKYKKIKIIYVGSQGQEDKFQKQTPSIPEWLSLIANSEYFITNSFHGCVFALQFRKKFMVYPVSGMAAAMNDRLTTLLYPLGLEAHLYSGDLQAIEDDIDYDLVFKRLDKQTLEAQELLNSYFK